MTRFGVEIDIEAKSGYSWSERLILHGVIWRYWASWIVCVGLLMSANVMRGLSGAGLC